MFNGSVRSPGRLSLLLLACLLVVVGSFGFGQTSSATPHTVLLAQNYPPPPPPPTPTPNPSKTPKPTKTPKAASCAQSGDLVNGGKTFKPKSSYHAGDAISVRGGQGCVAQNAPVTAVFDPAGNRSTIGATHGSSQGTYLVNGRVPAKAGPGTHVIQVNSGRQHYSTSITVTSRSKKAGFLSSTAGLATLGIIIALLALAIVLSPRRKRLLAIVAPTDASGVPQIDTSGFDPRIGRSERPARKRAPRKPQT